MSIEVQIITVGGGKGVEKGREGLGASHHWRSHSAGCWKWANDDRKQTDLLWSLLFIAPKQATLSQLCGSVEGRNGRPTDNRVELCLTWQKKKTLWFHFIVQLRHHSLLTVGLCLLEQVQIVRPGWQLEVVFLVCWRAVLFVQVLTTWGDTARTFLYALVWCKRAQFLMKSLRCLIRDNQWVSVKALLSSSTDWWSDGLSLLSSRFACLTN